MKRDNLKETNSLTEHQADYSQIAEESCLTLKALQRFFSGLDTNKTLSVISLRFLPEQGLWGLSFEKCLTTNYKLLYLKKVKYPPTNCTQTLASNQLSQVLCTAPICGADNSSSEYSPKPQEFCVNFP